jgi:Fe-S cluster assembly iron-binding protein IscA
VLTLTENASTVVKTITEQATETESAGLRISHEGADALQVAPAEAPQGGDKVLEEAGARVFLEETAAQTLDDKVLDAQVDESGSVQFSIGLQG